MGLGVDAIEAILKEHTYQPIDGDVLLIGNQTVYFTPESILNLMKKFNISSRLELDEIEIDTNTVNRLKGFPENLIKDFSIFKMLGAKSVKALDHSDYEGAEIIHDLSKPLPSSLHGIADFIVDGSTLDNTFNPALTIKSFNELLKPGGRILMLNTWSNYAEPYMIIPPLWYLDYFTLNRFVDCKIYISVYMPEGISNTFCIDKELHLNSTFENYVSTFVSPFEMCSVVFAEKGKDSTSDSYPIQQQYRPELQRQIYRSLFEVIRNNPRPHVCRSRSPIALLDVKRGHLFMNQNFEAVDPTSEARRLQLV